MSIGNGGTSPPPFLRPTPTSWVNTERGEAGDIHQKIEIFCWAPPEETDPVSKKFSQLGE